MNLWAFLMSEQNEDWCVGLSGLFISCATKTEAFDLGRGCDSPSGLMPHAPNAFRLKAMGTKRLQFKAMLPKCLQIYSHAPQMPSDLKPWASNDWRFKAIYIK